MGYRYIGSKSRVVGSIIEYIGTPKSKHARLVDAMCGTGIVAYEAARVGWPVVINDRMKNAVVMSEARLLSAEEAAFKSLGGYQAVIGKLNAAVPL